ncbi:MAG: iron-containing alcohol dehydrogenase [Promethearchaeota archaeon]
MVIQPTFGDGWFAADRLNSLGKYMVFTLNEPWRLLKPKITNEPEHVVFNLDMSLDNLNQLYNRFTPEKIKELTIVGIGGGSACDTAKFISWKFKQEHELTVPLILIPSIISVDAFLCSSIAVRMGGNVKYIGESLPQEILIDLDFIKRAPKSLNRAGVSDTISIASALGDWIIARDEAGERFDQNIFNEAKKIVGELMNSREDIREVSNEGIKALVNGFYREVFLCEQWGNARPEEGSEHFLAYCLESITREHYIHGQLIGLNILISLFLQEDAAVFLIEEIHQFFEDIKLNISPEKQNISLAQMKEALKTINEYVIKERLSYTIYNSPRLILNEVKIQEIINFINKL